MQWKLKKYSYKRTKYRKGAGKDGDRTKYGMTRRTSQSLYFGTIIKDPSLLPTCRFASTVSWQLGFGFWRSSWQLPRRNGDKEITAASYVWLEKINRQLFTKLHKNIGTKVRRPKRSKIGETVFNFQSFNILIFWPLVDYTTA